MDVWYWTHGNGYLKLKLDTWSLVQENKFNCHSNTCLLQSMNDPCLNILLLSFFEHEPALQIWLLSAMQPCWALCFDMEFYSDISWKSRCNSDKKSELFLSDLGSFWSPFSTLNKSNLWKLQKIQKLIIWNASNLASF